MELEYSDYTRRQISVFCSWISFSLLRLSASNCPFVYEGSHHGLIENVLRHFWLPVVAKLVAYGVMARMNS